MYNSAPKAQPPFAELECIDPLAFWEGCSARKPGFLDVEKLITKNKPIASYVQAHLIASTHKLI